MSEQPRALDTEPDDDLVAVPDDSPNDEPVARQAEAVEA